MGDLDTLFDPDSVALVGASSDPEKLSGRPARYLSRYGYAGDVYLVNPGVAEIDGQRCYDGVADLPEPVDVALILLPAELAADIVAECGERGIPFAVVIASGFSETGAEGEQRERELLETARENGVTLVGPNSQGVINLGDTLPLSFSSILQRDDLQPGSVSYVTQSGAFGGALLQLSQNRNVGTAKWVSTGNESDLTTLDFLEYFVEDPDTDTVVTYVERLREGQRLRRIGRRAAETDTDIVAMRVGASPAGKAAAESHTGSIASADEIYRSVFDQTGITRVHSIDEFVDAITAFASVPASDFPRTDGDRGLGVISMSGGAAVLIADTCDRLDLPLASLTEETRETIAAEIPDYGSETNPVDVTAALLSDPSVFNTCIGAVAVDPNVTGLVVQFGNSGGDIIETFADGLLSLRNKHDVVTATVFTGNPPAPSTAADLVDGGVLVFEDPVRSVRTMRNLADRATFLDSGAEALAGEPVDFASREPLGAGTDWGRTVDELESGVGLDVVDSETVDSAAGAAAAADGLGYPVALKLNPLTTAHKSEVGGVEVGLEDADEVRAAYDAMPADGDVVVQRMVEGTEVIVGVTEDDDFGPVMLFGPGGVFVELFDEFAYRTLPVSVADAREMIAETPVDRLLSGFRDRPPGDEDALAELLAAVSRAYCRYDVTELEVNPAIVTEDDALAVDLLLE